MEVKILKDAIEIAREKTNIAIALIRKGAYPAKRIADTLHNIYPDLISTQKKQKNKPKPEDIKYVPPIWHIQMRDPPMAIGLRPLSTGFLRKRKNLRLTIRVYTES
jgi:hypothetical protein